MSTNRMAALAAAFQKPQTTGTNERFKKFYPFWKMNAGEQAVVRFLPDANQENPWGFMVENLTHKLEINGQRKTVPCLTMYGESCPACALAKKFYDEGNDDEGRKYYKKREYLASVVVSQSPFEIEGDEEVRLLSLGPKIFKLIQEAFTSGDLEVEPFDLNAGYDFRIKKSMQGQYADYTLSSFAPRQSKLDEDVQARIEFVNLEEFRTPKCTRESLDAQLLAAQTGTAVGGNGGLNIPAATAPANVAAAVTPATAATPAAAVVATPAAVVETAVEPAAAVVPAVTADAKANDILAQIRNRVANA